jgi:hypothetical protein
MTELYKRKHNVETRWISSENPTGERQKGGLVGHGGKGKPFDYILPKNV